MNEIEACEIIERDNLAVVYVISSLDPIPNKDRIELCRMNDCGYTAIVEKGIHSVGDSVVFVKYDSIVPDVPAFSFMKEFKFRIKPKSFTVRDEHDVVIDKIYSQGIVVKLNALDLEQIVEPLTDLTSVIGVKKYITPMVGSGTSFGVMAKKGDFPTHIVSKTDESNVCQKLRALDEIAGLPVYVTTKYEGSSLSCMWDESRNELMVCSRNNQIGEHETNKFWQAVNKYNLKEKLQKYPHIVLQCELIGPGVQKNKLGLDSADLVVFNVCDKRDRKRLSYDDMIQFLKEIEVPMVSVCCEIDSFDWTFDKLQAFADIQKYPNGVNAEGIVIRPKNPFYSLVLKDVWSVKCINRNYTL